MCNLSSHRVPKVLCLRDIKGEIVLLNVFGHGWPLCSSFYFEYNKILH